MSGRPVVVAPLAPELPRWGRGPRLDAHALGRGPAPDLPGDGPIVITGACGGLAPGCRPGELVLPREVVAADGEVLVPCPSLRGCLAEALRTRGMGAWAGRLAESVEVVDGPDARGRLAASGADFVDQESASWSRRAAASGRSWVVLRFVSDAPGAELAWLRELLGRWPEEEPRAGEWMVALARRPRHLWRLALLAHRALAARRAVGRVLAHASWPP